MHWDKVNPANADHSMVWDKINGGSFRVDEGIMEALFGTLASRKTARESDNPSRPFPSSTTSAGTAAQICLLDSRKSQNIAIVLRSLALSRQDILDALLEGRGLSIDTLEKLSRLAPTKEEEDMIRDFSGNPSKLADAESFLFHLLRAVPSPFARLDAMLFRSNYGPEVAHLKQSLQTLEVACKELKNRGLFWKLLEAVLKAGNRMNAGTARGNAQAFNLKALCKLSDVKSTDGRTTLLHFVVEEVVRAEGKRCVVNRNQSRRLSARSMNRIDEGSSYSGEATSLQAGTREEREKEYMKLGLPIVGGLSEEFADVKKAAGIDHDALVATCSSLGARVKEIRLFLESCSSGGFVQEMREFTEAAEDELSVLRGEQVRVMELVTSTTEYYQPGASKDKGAHPLQLFMIVRDFLAMVDKTCVDIARNQQKKKLPPPPGAAPASPERGRRATARFPNLPAHFMSDNSKSSSSSDEEDGL